MNSGLIFVTQLRFIIPKASGWSDLIRAVEDLNHLCEQTLIQHKSKLDPENPMLVAFIIR